MAVTDTRFGRPSCIVILATSKSGKLYQNFAFIRLCILAWSLTLILVMADAVLVNLHYIATSCQSGLHLSNVAGARILPARINQPRRLRFQCMLLHIRVLLGNIVRILSRCNYSCDCRRPARPLPSNQLFYLLWPACKRLATAYFVTELAEFGEQDLIFAALGLEQSFPWLSLKSSKL